MNIHDKNCNTFVDNSPYYWSNDFSIKNIGISTFYLKKKSDSHDNYELGNDEPLFIKVEV